MENTIKCYVKGKVVLISQEDKILFDSHNWYLMKARQLVEKYYIVTSINKKTVYLHRIIMDAIKGEVVDHKNRNTLDCTRGNLRIVSHSLNRINCEVRQNKKSSSLKGAYFSKRERSKPWYSMMQVGDKKVWLGSFFTEQAAADAYNNAMEGFYKVAI